MDDVPDIDSPEILELFKTDIHGESIYERLFTAGNVYLIAAALGPTDTRESLIPFLTNDKSLDGEVKAIIAEQLGGFVKYVGGQKYATCLIPPLKSMIESDELFVRDKAIQSISKICSQVPAQQGDGYIFSLLGQLFSASISANRSAGCALLPYVYEYVSDQNKLKLRKSFLKCMADETPSVRRAALAAVPKLCQLFKQAAVVSEIIRGGISERLQDDDESIRVMISDCLPPIAAKAGHQDKSTTIVSIAKALSKDSSWWVRANIAKRLPDVITSYSSDFISSDLGSIILNLLRDLDPEVRIAATNCCVHIIDVLEKTPSYFVDNFLPEIISLASDRFPHVREEVASDILIFAKIVPENLAEKSIFPIIADLIEDPQRDVTIAVLKSFSGNFGAVNSFSVTKAVLPMLIEIAKTADWRVKIQIIKNFCLFLPFVNQEAIPTQIIPLIGEWLQDTVFAVRDEISRRLPDILTVIQSDQSSPGKENRDLIIGLIVKLSYAVSISSSIKQSAMRAVWYIGGSLPSDIISDKILPAVLLMGSDKVATVRITAAKTLHILKPYVDEQAKSKINLCLKLLSNDPDVDVKYFASNSTV